jgi:hypothetical protein
MSNISRFVIGALLMLTACGSSSPENFIEAQTREGCRKMKKCDESEWDAAGFDSVSDCVDETLDAQLPDGSTVRDAFVASCEDFDSGHARKCLAGARKVKRTCDDNAASSEQEDACANVCGNPLASELYRDPSDLEIAAELVSEPEPE